MRKTLVATIILGLTSLTVGAGPFVETGLTSSTMDVTRMVRTTIDTRMMENMTVDRHDGGAVWLDLTATKSEADHVGKTSGYKNDIWGINLGADIKKDNSFFGVVYSYAYSEGESRNNAQHLDSEGDFFAINIFGEQRFGNFAVSANGGWMHSHGEGRTAESTIIHSNTWTGDIGVKLALDVATVKVVPYAKIETTYIDTTKVDSGTRFDDVLVHQFPVGVNVSRVFDVGGWKVRPVVDAAFIKTGGDTSADYSYQGSVTNVQWLNDDTLYRGQIGLTAYAQNARLGLNYEYLGAGDGRAAHTLDVQAQYIF